MKHEKKPIQLKGQDLLDQLLLERKARIAGKKSYYIDDFQYKEFNETEKITISNCYKNGETIKFLSEKYMIAKKYLILILRQMGIRIWRIK